MVRAAATGVIDYSWFDPDDTWWWRRHGWLLQELEDRQIREAAEINHRHWLAYLGVFGIDDNSYEAARRNAALNLGTVQRQIFPWLADQIGEEGAQTAVESTVSTYASIYGKPGEERYEKMLKDLEAAAAQIRKNTERRRRLLAMRQRGR